MRLVLRLAVADLLHGRLLLLCNTAMMAGVLVPLLVLAGVKAGVLAALLGDLRTDPATLQIETRANASFTEADAARVRAWPEVAFVVLRPRAFADQVIVVDPTTRRSGAAVANATGPGDPLRPPGEVGPGGAAPSAALAAELGLASGAAIEVVAEAIDADTGEPERLVVPLTVAQVLPEAAADGRVVLLDAATLDLLEAFVDGYAIPALGVDDGRPLASRVAAFERMRVHARDMEGVAPLAARIEREFGVDTRSQGPLIAFWLNVERNLGAAVGILGAIGLAGLVAALAFSFWGEVARKRQLIAVLALLGLRARSLALFPMVQAAFTGAAGLALSFAIYGAVALAANRLFSRLLLDGAPVMALGAGTAGLVLAGVMALVVLAAAHAGRAARALDPAVVLREAP